MRLNLKVMELTGRLLKNDRENAGRKPSPVAPALRVGAAVLCILLCAISQNAVYVITVIAVELLRLALMPPEGFKGLDPAGDFYGADHAARRFLRPPTDHAHGDDEGV